MNKSLQMAYYNGLCKINYILAKSKEGRSIIMNQAVYMASSFSKLFYKNHVKYN